jgi:membrane protease YdiL (CAAX protease family)
LLLRNPRALGRRLLGLAPARLTASPFRLSEIFLAGAFAFGGAIMLQVVLVMVGKRYWPPPVDGSMGFFHVLVAAGFQLGLVAGLAHAWFWHLRTRLALPDAAPVTQGPVAGFAVVRDGFLTFLVVLPAVWLASLLWQSFLELLGVDAPPQDIVALFAKRGDWVSLSAMIGFALVCAPIAEELLFRVGLFRWLRGRIARSLALLLPALAFAVLHGSVSVLVPLMVLSIVFSLSYERSGHPAVTMIAHSLFNLNTLVLVLAGFPTSDAELRSAFQQLVSFLN